MPSLEHPSLSGPPKSASRTVLVALVLLGLMMGGTYALRWLSQEAIIDVQADEATAAVLNARDGMLVRTDGPERFPLRAGRQSVRAGTYKIELPPDPEAAKLKFSPATFQAKTGERVLIEVKLESKSS